MNYSAPYKFKQKPDADAVDRLAGDHVDPKIAADIGAKVYDLRKSLALARTLLGERTRAGHLEDTVWRLGDIADLSARLVESEAAVDEVLARTMANASRVRCPRCHHQAPTASGVHLGDVIVVIDAHDGGSMRCSGSATIIGRSTGPVLAC